MAAEHITRVKGSLRCSWESDDIGTNIYSEWSEWGPWRQKRKRVSESESDSESEWASENAYIYSQWVYLGYLQKRVAVWL